MRRDAVRHGSTYGGWYILEDAIPKDATILSFGIGKDLSFDISIANTFDAQIHAFDPTPASLDWVAGQTLPTQLQVHPYGIGSTDETVSFYPPEKQHHISHSTRGSANTPAIRVPLRRISTIINTLNIQAIDILKMDIEGSEFDVLPEVLKLSPLPGQLLVEFHHNMRGLTVRQTRDAIEAIRRHQYHPFSISDTGREISFAHERILDESLAC